MRKVHAGGLLVAAFALAASPASAQSASGDGTTGGPPGRHAGGRRHNPQQQSSQQRHDQQPLILQREQLGTTAYAQVARTRMRNGDCAGALDAFDAAIAHSIDPTLRRDRGLCFEQLGDPYPAIDDYRAYLTADPEAPDADGIGARLARLEQQTSGKSSQNGTDDDDTPGAANGSASASVTVSVGGSGASGSAAGGGTDGSSAPPKRDAMEYVEHDDDTLKSPLRRGKGYSIAPFFAEHKWFFQNSSFGDSDTWAEAVGLLFRYSFSHVSSVFVEAGYQRFNSDSTDVAEIQGLTSQVGLELRFPLDENYDNQLLVAPGVGFDHIVVSSQLLGGQSTSEGAIIPRVRVGWRHLVDTSAGIDLSLDAGVGKFAAYSTGDFPFGGSATESALLALNVALVWGL